jgi:hypothetical protein
MRQMMMSESNSLPPNVIECKRSLIFIHVMCLVTTTPFWNHGDGERGVIENYGKPLEIHRPTAPDSPTGSV